MTRRWLIGLLIVVAIFAAALHNTKLAVCANLPTDNVPRACVD